MELFKKEIKELADTMTDKTKQDKVIEEIGKEFNKIWYSDFNHINAQRKVCSHDCEESFDLQEVEEWNRNFIIESLSKAIKEEQDSLIKEIDKRMAVHKDWQNTDCKEYATGAYEALLDFKNQAINNQ